MNEQQALIQVVVVFIERGADIVRIGKASEHGKITVEEMQKFNKEKGFAFTYESAKDEIIIKKTE